MIRDTVLQPSSNHLRLHIEEHAALAIPQELAGWPALQAALLGLTGWKLDCDRGPPPTGAVKLGELLSESDRTAGQFYCQKTAQRPKAEQADKLACDLARAVVSILGELHRTRQALRNREAELATAVPVIARPEQNAQFSDRLEAVLRGAVEGLKGMAAALYVLDDATTELKLRSQHGLDPNRFLAPARPLRTSLADLEALAGHAVVLEDACLFQRWNVPEPCGSAVCVPVSSADTLLGTLWFYCDTSRSFSDEQTQLLEIIAGRLAAELECKVLANEVVASGERREQSLQLEDWHDERLQIAPPLCEGWQVSGASLPSAHRCGDFHTWRVDGKDQLWLASAAVAGGLSESLLNAATLRGALQASLLQPTRPARVLKDLNEVLWSGSAGCEGAAAFCGQVDPRSGQLTFTSAGLADAYILRPHGWEPIVSEHPALGLGPDWETANELLAIHPGDVLLVVSHRELAKSESGRPLNTTWLAEGLLRYMHLSAQELAELATSLLGRQGAELWARSIMVVKRCESGR